MPGFLFVLLLLYWLGLAKLIGPQRCVIVDVSGLGIGLIEIKQNITMDQQGLGPKITETVD